MNAHDRRDGERGQALPLFVLMLIALLAATGLVVDVGSAWAQERSQQKVSDVAAMAGATKEANDGTRAEIIAAATRLGRRQWLRAGRGPGQHPAGQRQVRTRGRARTRCSPTTARPPRVYPCWVEVVITKPHDNFFAGIIGQGTWDVAAKGVAVGGIANAVSNGLSPIMFNEDRRQSQQPEATKQFCNPQDNKCIAEQRLPASTTCSSTGRRSASPAATAT